MDKMTKNMFLKRIILTQQASITQVGILTSVSVSFLWKSDKPFLSAVPSCQDAILMY